MHAAATNSPLSTRGFRSPGERAFDRCLFPFLLHLLQALALGVASLMDSRSDDGMPPVPRLIVWALFSLDLLLCGHWAWAFRSVIAAWRDPFARVLRFSSLGLLLLYTPIIVGILRLPFR
jgi:hypothetical protein